MKCGIFEVAERLPPDPILLTHLIGIPPIFNVHLFLLNIAEFVITHHFLVGFSHILHNPLSDFLLYNNTVMLWKQGFLLTNQSVNHISNNLTIEILKLHTSVTEEVMSYWFIVGYNGLAHCVSRKAIRDI